MNMLNRKKIISCLIFILIFFLLTACDPTVDPQPIASAVVSSTPSSNQISPNIQVIPASSAQPRSLSPRYIKQNNCDNSTEYTYTPSQKETITRIVELGIGVEISTGGVAKLPAFGEVNIGAKISGTYNKTYGSNVTFGEQLTYTIPPHTLIEYEIRTIEFWQTGTVIISNGTDIFSDTYAFRDSSTLSVTPVEKPCPTPTTLTATPTVALTILPEPTFNPTTNQPVVVPSPSTTLTLTPTIELTATFIPTASSKLIIRIAKSDK